jgi:histone acetyltransferase (RNA polymerase elongator complex component)
MALIIPFFIQHRGCAHRCIFCNQWAATGASEASKKNIEDDLYQTIELWLSRSRAQTKTQVAFYGGSFTCLEESTQKRLLGIVDPFIKQGVITSIRLSTRPDCMSQDICSFLRDYGVETVELGVQSLDDRVLQRSLRGHTSDQCREAAALLAKNDFELGIQMMPGLPGESTRSFLKGVSEVISFHPDFVRLYPVIVLKDTGLAKLYNERSWIPLSMNKAIALTRRARQLFIKHDITVVRMGLQPSDELTKRVLAGPYHPSFGELVVARAWYLRARKILAAAGPGKRVTITISPRDQSAFVGPSKQNIKRLEALSFGSNLVLETDTKLERDRFRYVVN